MLHRMLFGWHERGAFLSKRCVRAGESIIPARCCLESSLNCRKSKRDEASDRAAKVSPKAWTARASTLSPEGNAQKSFSEQRTDQNNQRRRVEKRSLLRGLLENFMRMHSWFFPMSDRAKTYEVYVGIAIVSLYVLHLLLRGTLFNALRLWHWLCICTGCCARTQ